MTYDLTFILPDRVGSLAEAFAALRDSRAAMHGCAGFPAWAGEGILHVLVDDVDQVRDALRSHGMLIREERELLVTDARAGTPDAARVLELIAASGTNIDLIYTLLDGRLALGVNRPEVARAALEAEAVRAG